MDTERKPRLRIVNGAAIKEFTRDPRSLMPILLGVLTISITFTGIMAAILNISINNLAAEQRAFRQEVRDELKESRMASYEYSRQLFDWAVTGKPRPKMPVK